MPIRGWSRRDLLLKCISCNRFSVNQNVILIDYYFREIVYVFFIITMLIALSIIDFFFSNVYYTDNFPI